MPINDTEILPLPTDCTDIILDYASDTPWALNRSMLFSRKNWTLKQILYLAEHAGPLEQFDPLVRQLINHELEHKAAKHVLIDSIFTLGNRKGTLIECLVTGLDKSLYKHSYQKHNPKNINKPIVIPRRLINEGMAKRFVSIVKELLPQHVSTILTQAERAAPIESEFDRTERENNNEIAINQLFDSFTRDDKDEQQKAVAKFSDFVNETRRFSTDEHDNLINNLYYVNLIHLIEEIFYFLYIRGEELSGGLCGRNATRICFEIMGPILQANLPPHTLQLLTYGLKNLFRKEAPCDNDLRKIDPYVELGNHFYFNHEGLVNLGVLNTGHDAIHKEAYAIYGCGAFNEYLEQLNNRNEPVISSESKHSCKLM